MKDIKDHLNKLWLFCVKGLKDSLFRDVHSSHLYRFSTIQTKILGSYFASTVAMVLTFIWKHKKTQNSQSKWGRRRMTLENRYCLTWRPRQPGVREGAGKHIHRTGWDRTGENRTQQSRAQKQTHADLVNWLWTEEQGQRNGESRPPNGAKGELKSHVFKKKTSS